MIETLCVSVCQLGVRGPLVVLGVVAGVRWEKFLFL